MDDTPTPTAQDAAWDSLGIERNPLGWYWLKGGDVSLRTWPRSRRTSRFDSDPTWDVEFVADYGHNPRHTEQWNWSRVSRDEAWTICAALVLLAAGVLSAGAQQ